MTALALSAPVSMATMAPTYCRTASDAVASDVGSFRVFGRVYGLRRVWQPRCGLLLDTPPPGPRQTAAVARTARRKRHSKLQPRWRRRVW